MPADAQTQQFVEFAGNVGRIVEQRILRTFPVTGFLETLNRMGGIDTGILPYDCAYMKEGRYADSSRQQPGATYRLHVCVEKPRVATIRFQGRDAEDENDDGYDHVRTFAVAFPWTALFVLYHNNGLASVRYHAIVNPDGLHPNLERTELYLLPVPNTTKGNFCLGELRLDSSQPFPAKTNHIVRFVNESVWNNDLMCQWGKSATDRPNVKSFADWAEKTKEKGPSFWRELLLIPAEKTFGDLVKELTT